MANIKTPDGGFYVDEQQFDVDYHKKAVSVKGAALQQDYAQNDPNAPDYIKNRPFYNNPNISWKYKGSFEDEEIVEVERNGKKKVFVKVSDDAPSKEDVLGSNMVFMTPDGNVESYLVTEEDVYSGEEGLVSDYVIIIYKDDGVQFPDNVQLSLSKGTWVESTIINGVPYPIKVSLTKFNKSVSFSQVIGPQIFYRKTNISDNKYRIGINESDDKELETHDYTPELVHALATGAVCYTESLNTGNNRTSIVSVSTVRVYFPKQGGYPSSIIIATPDDSAEYIIGEPIIS